MNIRLELLMQIKKKDGFFDQIGGMKLEEDDDMFNLSNFCC